MDNFFCAKFYAKLAKYLRYLRPTRNLNLLNLIQEKFTTMLPSHVIWGGVSTLERGRILEGQRQGT